MAEKITKSYLIGSESFQSISGKVYEMWNLYVKNIIFVYSLPILTSTWHSNYHNRPGRYMSRELKSDNINMERALT
jgi:hypothetical protein